MPDRWAVNRSDGIAYGHDYREHLWYTIPQLKALPTLAQGQADDLKIDTGHIRIWLSRCTVADGEPVDHKVTIEVVDPRGTWHRVDEYKAMPVPYPD